MALLNLEGYWQNILATFVENGNINIRDKHVDVFGGIRRENFTC